MKMSNQYRQEEISDEEEDANPTSLKSPESEFDGRQQSKSPQKNTEKRPQKSIIQRNYDEDSEKEEQKMERMSQKQEQMEIHNNKLPKCKIQQFNNKLINHQEIGKFANITMELEEEQKGEINLKIIGNEVKGSALSKWTAYLIKGYDKNGDIDVCRRFSEFHALRLAIVKRWPGCFVPSIPNKNYLMKNDKEQIAKRQRYLNDFLHKMAKIPHLYNSEQFQAFLKSKDTEVSNLYTSWPSPTTESIISKYRSSFGALAGKEINQETNDIVTQFYSKIKKNQSLFEKYRAQAKNLALSKDKLNRSFPRMFDIVFPSYEKVLLAEYVNGNEGRMVYMNSDEVKLAEQAPIAHDVCRKNPFWILYDLLKHEERDGQAFIESFNAIEAITNKKNSIEAKIKDNQKAILELGQGKKNVKGMSSKGSSEQVKYKLEVETQELKKQKDLLWNLMDIISALIVFIEIPAYKQAKINFYQNTLRKIGGYEINVVQICAEIWSNTAMSGSKARQNCFEKL